MNIKYSHELCLSQKKEGTMENIKIRKGRNPENLILLRKYWSSLESTLKLLKKKKNWKARISVHDFYHSSPIT